MKVRMIEEKISIPHNFARNVLRTNYWDRYFKTVEHNGSLWVLEFSIKQYNKIEGVYLG